MKRFQIGVPKAESIPKRSLFFLVSDWPRLHYNGGSWLFSSPRCHALSRPNLTLDEQSFQGLLSAAFIIQEHNDRRKQARQAQAERKARATARTIFVPENACSAVGPRCG